jgi:HEAT repeat protein
VRLAATPFLLGALLALASAAHAARPRGVDSTAAPRPLRSIAIAEDQRRWSDGELRGFLDHELAGVRARAALAVGRLQDSTSVDALIGMLDDPSGDVRREAVFALGQLGRPEARPSLIAQLGDMDAEVVRLTVEALGKLGDKRATAVVTERSTPACPACGARPRWRSGAWPTRVRPAR